MIALVTGGGGFLGRRIVELLRERGDDVRVLARGSYPALVELGCECHQGDLRTPQDVAKAVAGVDVVFHVAAMAAMWGDREQIFGINVDGTRNLLSAAQNAGVQRFVYTSSPSVVYDMKDLCGVDESQPYPRKFSAVYPESKAVAEQEALAANAANFATCALRPHLIWGPRDTHIVPMLVQRARAGKLSQVGAGTNLVDVSYVDNAALAHLQAADALAPGSVVAGNPYFIGDEAPVNLWGWVRSLLERLGGPGPSRVISYPAARAIATGFECLYRLLPLSGEPLLTRFTAAQFATSHYFSHEAAGRDFGYQPTISNEEGLRRTVQWFAAHPVS